MTVRGLIPASELGITLPHEHVMLDFIGAEKAERSRYKRNEVFDAVLPYLENFRDFGGQTLVECTPAYIGRDVELLRKLSEASRLNLITNTGYYGAAGNKFLPRHAFRETADELAFHWLADWTGGIEETDIRPGSDEGSITNTFKQDGRFRLLVEELNRRGGPGLFYEIAAAPLTPGFTLSVGTERVSGPPGSEVEVTVTAQRRDFDGPILLRADARGPVLEVTNQIIAAKSKIGRAHV